MNRSRLARRGLFALAAASAASTAAVLGLRALRRRAYPLQGKVAIVAGAPVGLDLEVARELGRRGTRLAILAGAGSALDDARADLVTRGLDAIAVPCELAHPDAVVHAVAEVEAQLGPVDILVCGGDVRSDGRASVLSADEVAHAMRDRFWGIVHASLAVLPSMRARGAGRIVHIAPSDGAPRPRRAMPADCALRAASGFSEALEAELSRVGITVLTVVPGHVREGLEQGRALPASRAAARIVDALAEGKHHLVIGWQARLRGWAHAVSPGIVADAIERLGRTRAREAHAHL